MGWTHDDFVDGTFNIKSDVAGVLIETGAEAFTPVSSSGPCGANESFQVTSADLPAIEGCYQETPESYANEGADGAIWSVSGSIDAGQVVVLGTADEGPREYVSEGNGTTTRRSWCVSLFCI